MSKWNIFFDLEGANRIVLCVPNSTNPVEGDIDDILEGLKGSFPMQVMGAELHCRGIHIEIDE